MEDLIKQIELAAPKVAAEHEAHVAAVSAERDAEATVLTHAIEVARPALKALSKRIIKTSYETAGRNGCNPVERTTYFDERGLLLVDDYERQKDESGNRGSLAGCQLWLLTDGTLAETTREGSWSHWQGEANEWSAAMHRLTPREAMDEYDLNNCLSSLAEALKKQFDGNKTERTRAATERAERLGALVTLTK